MIFIIIAAAIAAADILIKRYINKTFQMHEERFILNGRIKITRCHNDGAIMNSFRDKKKLVLYLSFVLLLLTSVFFALLIPKKGKSMQKLAFSFIVGGGISNVFDRGSRGYVTDYFSFAGKVPEKLKKVVFNIADLFIFTGSAIAVVKELFN